MPNPKKTVLIVDDDADLRLQTSAALQDRYNVLTAASGRECLERLATTRPDCIVMDVMMDDLSDGLTTARQIRTAPDTRAIPILMLTSANESYDYRSQVEADYFPHECWLDKPVSPERLRQEIAALLGA
jgi:CheY-like chemotaxis protein